MVNRLVYMLLAIAITSLSFSTFSNESKSVAKNLLDLSSRAENTQVNKWILVLDDPRPERLKGWKKAGQYHYSGHYNHNLALKRLGRSVVNDLAVELVAEWPIESIDVHCLIINIPVVKQKEVLNNLALDKRIKWVQRYQSFIGQAARLSSKKLTKKTKKKQSDRTDILANNKQVDPYKKLQNIFEQINIQQVSQIFDGTGIKIAMIDSGVDMTHPELVHALVEQLDFVEPNNTIIPAEHHGTGIAGVMVAKKNNGEGIAGLSPAAKLYAYRGCWEKTDGQTVCDSLTLARALDRVAQLKPEILNLSLTGPKDRLLDALVKAIIRNGTQIIAAYDNQRKANNRFPMFQPGVIIAQDPESLFDSRTEQKKSIAPLKFNSVVFMPGKEILTTQPNKTYAFMSGNSMASAHLASILAIIAQASPDTDLKQVDQLFYKLASITISSEQATMEQQTDVCGLLLALEVQLSCQRRF